MTMFKEFVSVFLGLFLFSTIVDATLQESLTLKVFSPDDRPSDEQLLAMLKKIESHNYTKEVTKTSVSEPGSGKPINNIAYFYYKLVKCSQMQEIVQELEKLIYGPFVMKVGAKFNREFKARNMNNMKQCKVGLEIHYKVDGGSSTVKRGYTRRQKRSSCIGLCFCCKGEEVAVQ